MTASARARDRGDRARARNGEEGGKRRKNESENGSKVCFVGMQRNNFLQISKGNSQQTRAEINCALNAMFENRKIIL